MKYRILIPIINKFEGEIPLPLAISNEIGINTIGSDDFFIIHRFLEDEMAEFKQLVKSNQACITIATKKSDDDTLLQECIKIQFLLNYFQKENPIYFFVALLVSETNEVINNFLFQLPATYLSLIKKAYEFQPELEVQTIIEMYDTINKASSNKKLFFTLEKFNELHYEQDKHSKYVDATVALESVIQSEGELSYKFRIVNAILCEADAGNRLAAYDLFNSLYSVRSGIVHGDLDGKSRKKHLETVQDKYETIYSYLRSILFYYIAYLKNNDSKNWEAHILGLIIGFENRIV